MKTTLEEKLKVSVNVLQVTKNRTIERPSYFLNSKALKHLFLLPWNYILI